MKIDLKTRVSGDTSDAFRTMLGGAVSDDKAIHDIPLDQLLDYESQPFKRYTPERLEGLAKSIRTEGVLEPAIVRPVGDKYLLLAGHNRRDASILAGKTTLPCIIRRDVDDMGAERVMLDTNLEQRRISPSELAFAYKRRMEAAGEDEKDGLSGIAQSTDQSRRTISYYIRLTGLEKGLLDRVDAGEIPLHAGVELSYLDSASQCNVLEYLDAYPIKLDLKTAQLLRQEGQDGGLTRARAEEILGKKPAKKGNAVDGPKPVRISIELDAESFRSFFPGRSKGEVKEEILQILKEHFEGTGI